MTLRLVLVSIVACVGLSLPSAERLGRWTRSGPGTAGRNGVWQNGELLDEGRFVVVADALDPAPVVPAQATPTSTTADAPAPSPEAETAAAQTETTAESTAPAPGVETVATGPQADVDAEAVNAAWLAAIATEAAPPADTGPAIEAQPEALSADALAAIATEAAPPADTAEAVAEVTLPETEFVPVEAPAVVAQEPAPDSAQAAEPAQPAAEKAPEVTTEAAVAQADADQAFGVVVDEMVLAFTKDNDRVAAKAQPVAGPAAVALTAPAAVTPSAESMVVDEEADDLGDALAHAADGLAQPAAAPTKAGAPREDALKHAMRLTREAVNAWASLLHGPALMTLGR